MSTFVVNDATTANIYNAARKDDNVDIASNDNIANNTSKQRQC